MRRLIGVVIAGVLIVGSWTCSPARAGDVIVNGVNLGVFTSFTINYKADKTGLVVITTQPKPGVPPAVIPEEFGLKTCYASKMELYLTARANKYPGTVLVDGVTIRSGVKAPVLFQTMPDNRVCRS